MWLYHSHFDETRDTLAGLSGSIVIVAKGMADAHLKPKDVDQEVFALFQIFDEDKSLYIDQNIERYLGKGLTLDTLNDFDDFNTASAFPNINGFVSLKEIYVTFLTSILCNLLLILNDVCSHARTI